jgi:hypothetical protein
MVFAVLLSALAVTASASAQPLGTYRWQLLPYCNVVTLAVVAEGPVFALDGFDDQCGAAQRASVGGSAFLNPDGTVGLGFTVVVVPSAAPVHVDARISLASLSGSWQDSAGRVGNFAFTTGAPVNGPPRPLAPPAVFGTVITQPPGGSDRGISATVTTDIGFVANAAAIYGLFGPPSSVDAVTSAGVRGDSNSATGVLGATQSGVGVQGFALGGIGVKGQAVNSGTGVLATSGPFYNPTSSALTIDGSVKVTPLGPAFVHTSSLANVFADCTYIDHPLTNGDPAAMLFVTHIFNGTALDALGVYFGGNGKWCIYRESIAAMPSGQRFNVLVFRQ